MESTPKQVNVNGSNGSLGKRKKSRGNRSTYLSKWLDKTMHHVQEATPSVDYDFVSPTMNWQIGSQFAPGFDPYRQMYGAPEPMSLPTLPSYYTPQFPHAMPLCPTDQRYVQSVSKSVQVQRPRLRRRSDQRAEEVQSTPNCVDDSNSQPKNLSDQDYASLPPIITSVGDTNSNSDMKDEKDEGSNARRYSDPCIRGLPDVARPANGDVDSESDASSSASNSQVGSRLLSCLLDQIATLKIANQRLSKDLFDTRAELESTRQHNAILHKGSGSSIGVTPNHSLDSGLLGGQYSPGFLTDLVREIRDAARIREEAMYTRVKAMVLERTDNLASTEAKLTEKTLDEIKSSLRASEADKRRMMDRINKLEDEMHALRMANGQEPTDKLTNGITEDPETERLRLQKELNDMRRAKKNAEDNVHTLERLVTQLRSKFNGIQTNGPDSLPSEPEHESTRIRRVSLNSSNNSTVVFGPVTDL